MKGKAMFFLLSLSFFLLSVPGWSQSGIVGNLEVIDDGGGMIKFNIYDVQIKGMKKLEVHFGMRISQAGDWLEDSWVATPPERIIYDPVYWEGLAIWFHYPLEYLMQAGDPDQPYFGSFFAVDTGGDKVIVRRDIEFSLAADETETGFMIEPEEGSIVSAFNWVYAGKRWKESFRVAESDYSLSAAERDSFQPLYGESDYQDGYIVLRDTDIATFYSDLYGYLYQKNRHRLQSVNEKLLQLREHYDLDYRELAELVISWVQYTTYELPEKKYGIYTQLELIESGKGDCDTRSVILYTILKDLGYDVLIYYSEFYQHAMLGIARVGHGTYLKYGGEKYYFVETTATGWEIGDLPPEWSDTDYWNILIPLDR